MMRYEKVLQGALLGAIGGLVGTVAVTIGMKGGPVLMQQLGLAPEGKEEAEEPEEKLAEKVSEEFFETPIEEDTKQVAGQAIHWGYGIAWGTLYGLVQSGLRLPDLLHGTLFGGLVGVVASTVVPAMHLSPPPSREPMSKNVMMLFLHLLYGWVTALTFRALSTRS
jgi:uncharacterized membrane protein YagU involved in acid resistance